MALVCSLLGIRTNEELFTHPLRGAIFETFAMSECFKYFYHHNETPPLYFRRDVQGHEIDVIVEKTYGHTVPIEIKAGRMVNDNFFKALYDWQKITSQHNLDAYVIYGGDQTLQRKQGVVYSWRAVADLLRLIYPV